MAARGSKPEAPVLPSPGAHAAPAPAMPAPDGSSDEGDTSAGAAGDHPMAHLMQPKTAASEASRRAAEARAIKKKQAKKVKYTVIACMLVFTVAVGPPLFNWLSNAINEAGTSQPDDPAE